MFLSLLLFVPFASGSPEVADPLAQRLGLEAAVADEVAQVIDAARIEADALEQTLRAEGEALRAARASGDVRAMKKHVTSLRKSREALADLRLATEDAILDQLTIEQQADYALMRLERLGKREKVLERLRERRQEAAIPAFE